MIVKDYIQFIKELVMYLQSNNYKFEFTVKPIIYNLTLQTYIDNVNKKISNLFMIYKSSLISFKSDIKQYIHLLPEEQFCVYNIIDNKKYTFKINHDLLLKLLENNNNNYQIDIFKEIFIVTDNILDNIISKIISFNDKTKQHSLNLIIHAEFLKEFLTRNIQNMINNDSTLLTNLIQITDNMHLNKYNLYIDLNCNNIYDVNNIVSILTNFSINLQNKDSLLIKEVINNIATKFYNCIEDIYYNFNNKSVINFSFVLKDYSLPKLLLLIYLFNNTQYI